jgi:hypothetical protein
MVVLAVIVCNANAQFIYFLTEETFRLFVVYIMHFRPKNEIYFDGFNFIAFECLIIFLHACFLMIYQVRQHCLLSTMGNYTDVASEGKINIILLKKGWSY